MERKVAAKGVASVLLSVVFLVLLSTPLGILPPIGGLANPGGGIWSVADQAEHPTFQQLTFPELDGTAAVYRDGYGIPHIFASTEHDVFFAQGYVHAQDRMWQMDFMRRVGRGELAEIFGARIGGLDVVEVDTFLRAIGLPSLARQFWANTTTADPEYVPLSAYAEGVNAFLHRAGTAGLALEFKLLDYRPRDWIPEDTLALGLFLAWSLSGSFEDAELALLRDGLGEDAVDELFPVLGPFQRPVDPRPGTRGGDSGTLSPRVREATWDLLAKRDALAAITGFHGPWLGSNNWAVHGSRTDTGKPRLANDPHLSLQLPAVWYENHLVGPGVDVYGVSFPGAPTVILGQNRNVAWGFTNVGADVVDLYVETVSGTSYFFDGAWRPLEQRTEVIRVKGGTSVRVTINATVHGPLITERGEPFAMRWTARDSPGLLRAFLGMNRAQDWTQFRDALRHFGVPAQNVVYADVEGDIAMRSNGLYPIREQRGEGRYPLDGASGDHEWLGYVPFDDYPESINPIEDFVLSANQQPQPDSYPYYLGWSWDPGYRARRINEMLEADDRVTSEEIRAMQLDTLDVMAREFVPFVGAAVTGNCPTPTCSQALAALTAWDFHMDEDEAAPAIWWRFANHLRDEIFGDEWEDADVSGLMLPMPNVMEDLLKNNPTSEWFDDVRTAVVETWQDIMRRSFGLAVDDVAAEIGDDVGAWRWGDVHRRVLPHLTQLDPLGRGPFPASGSSLTVNVAPGDLASAGPSWRLLADLSDVTKSVGVYPGGQSGNPVSHHYDDLLDLYLRGDYHELILPASAAEMPTAKTESTLILRGS